MKCLRPLLLIVLLALSGCARMTVQVDIFDRTGLDSRDVVESNARLAAAQQAAAVANNLYAKHAAEILYEVQLVTAELVKQGATNVETASFMRDSVSSYLAKNIAVLSDSRDRAAKLVDDIGLLSGARRHDRFRLAMRLFEDADVAWKASWQAMYSETVRMASIMLGGADVERHVIKLSTRNTAVGIAARNFIDPQPQRLDLLTAGLGLFRDPLAAFVINAPDRYWRGRYNQAFGRGSFGNTELAIQMQAPAMFSVKSIKQSSSRLTQASLQVLKQGVKMVGAAYGVPLPSSTPSVPAVGAITGLPGKASSLVPAGDPLDAVRPLSRRATVDLMASIIAQRKALEGQDVKARNAAVARINQQFSTALPEIP